MSRDDDPTMPATRDSLDPNTATEAELLAFTAIYLERIKAHPRMSWAVRRAIRRLEKIKEGNGHA